MNRVGAGWLGHEKNPLHWLGLVRLAARWRDHTYLHQKSRSQHLYISKALFQAIGLMIFTLI